MPGAAGAGVRARGLAANHRVLGLREKKLPTKREKYEVPTRFRRRNVLPACKMICKQENLWYLGIEFVIVVLFVLFHFQLELGLL